MVVVVRSVDKNSVFTDITGQTEAVKEVHVNSNVCNVFDLLSIHR